MRTAVESSRECGDAVRGLQLLPVDRPALVCGTVHAACAGAGRALADGTVLPVLRSDASNLPVHGLRNETGSVYAGYGRSARTGHGSRAARRARGPSAAGRLTRRGSQLDHVLRARRSEVDGRGGRTAGGAEHERLDELMP